MGAVVLLFFRNWLNSDLPTTRLHEAVPRLTYSWQLRQALLKGHPLQEWSVYEFAGYPLARYIPYPVWLLLALLSVLLPISLETSLKFLYVAFFWLSAVTMNEYVLCLTRDRGASFLAGLIYALFPFHMHIAVEALEHVAFWAVLPLPFLLYERVRQSGIGRISSGLLMGLALASFPLADTEHTIVVAPFLLLYLVLREAAAFRKQERKARETLTFSGIAALVGLGLTAAFVIPGAMELSWMGIHFQQGTASGRTVEYLDIFSVPPVLLLDVLVQRVQGRFDPPWYYLGGGTVALASIGALRAVRKRSSTILHLILLGLAILLIAGPRLPINLFYRLPLLKNLYPFRGMMVVGFSLAVLAGEGGRWVTGLISDNRVRLALLSAVGLLVTADYLPASAAVTATPSYFYPDEIEAGQWLRRRGGDFRVWEPAHYLDTDANLFDYFLTQTRIPRFEGYWDISAPRHVWRLYRSVLALEILAPTFTIPMDLASIKYLLIHTRGEPVYEQLIKRLQERHDLKVVWHTEHITIFENLNWKPLLRGYGRAVLYLGDSIETVLEVLPHFIANEVAMVSEPVRSLNDRPLPYFSSFELVMVDGGAGAEELELLEKLRTTGVSILDLRELAINEVSERLKRDSLPPSDSDLTIQWERPTAEEVRATVDAQRPAILMLSESWYPNWHVYVDGEEHPLLRVNYAFQGVAIANGKHQVIFRYEKPWYVWLGYGTTLTTIAGLVCWGVMTRRGRQNR